MTDYRHSGAFDARPSELDVDNDDDGAIRG